MWFVQTPQGAPAGANEVVVQAREEPGESAAASEGVALGEELARRPLARPAALLEAIPGVLATQHSGAGKANQLFLRGFNLDHGTDLLVQFEGAPVNLPSHGHGQGYADLNFLIPELVESASYRKGPYFADVGDFGSAGSVAIDYVRRLDRPILRGTFGEHDYARGFVAQSERVGKGDVLLGFEAFEDDGPWKNPDDYRRFNGVLKWSEGDERRGSSATLFGMSGEWNATDQIPRRAVESGALDRFDAIDPTDGGEASRAGLSGEWHRDWGSSRTELRAWVAHSDLDLFSNFTYFRDDPVNGDQFEQRDERVFEGLDARQEWRSGDVRHSAGVQARHDEIENGLFHTQARTVLGVTREDEIDQLSLGLWYENEVRWMPSLRTIAGVRGDVFRFDVESDDPANSGEAEDSIASAKFGLVLGPWSDVELFANAGQGFHSNDARGVETTVDPASGAAVEPVDALVRTEGAELGARATLGGLTSSLALWLLDSDSEILFVGDAGTTAPSAASRRYGVELANDWRVTEHWILDLDASWSRARFRDDDPTGDHVPGALSTVLTAGLTWLPREDHFTSLRARHFGPRDLTTDGSKRSSESTLLDLSTAWRADAQWTLELGVFNLFDEDANDIEYAYSSQLPGEPAPVSDVHFHPSEGRTLRVGVSASW